MEVKIDSVTQEDVYACIRFDVGGFAALLRVGPTMAGNWYAEVLSVRWDYLINQSFDNRDEAAAYAMRLYEKVVVDGDTSFR